MFFHLATEKLETYIILSVHTANYKIIIRLVKNE